MTDRIVRFHHVTHNITRANIPAAREFYGSLLGLEEIRPMGDPTNERLIWFAVADQQLHLVVRDHADNETSRHLAIVVQDFDELVRRLEKAGIRLDELKPGQHWSLRPDGSKFAFCYDPDLNRIELMGF
jgi:catechol 2,3-dioxygenase-like lactoylglutathione lyase family enzyme